MAHHEGGLHLAHDVDQPVLGLAVHLERIVAEVEELDVVDVERPGRVLGLLAALRP
jgi:hypothetical protein